MALNESSRKEALQMVRHYDLVIVGGGVVGLSTAYYAALNGAVVGVVERHGPGDDCASASAGWLVPSYCYPLTTPHNLWRGLGSLANRDSAVQLRPRMSPAFARWLVRFLVKSVDLSWIKRSESLLARLHRESFALHRELAERAQGAYPFYTRGLLHVYLSDTSWRDGRRDAQQRARHGIAYTLVDPPRLHDWEPTLGSAVAGAVHYPGDAWLAPRSFMAWLAGQVKALGVDIHYGCDVYQLRRRGRQVTALATTLGTMGADQVVLATGAWLPQLTGQLGSRLPMEAAKGYSVTFHPPDPLCRLPLGLEDHGAVLVPYEDRARIIFGLEFRGLDLNIDARRLKLIPGLSKDYLPRARWGPAVEVRRGLRPVSADGMPVMGRLADDGNVFVAGGHDQKGLSLGPVTGYRLAQLLAGNPPDDVDRQLSPRRLITALW